MTDNSPVPISPYLTEAEMAKRQAIWNEARQKYTDEAELYRRWFRRLTTLPGVMDDDRFLHDD